jgi:hypothetical protein
VGDDFDGPIARRAVLAGLAASGAAGLAGCGLVKDKRPRSSIRFRMVVTLDTPEGEKSGSSVIEVTTIKGRPFGGDTGLTTLINGAAPRIRLSRSDVYALLYSERWDQSYPELLFDLGLRLGEVRPPLSRSYMPHEWMEYQAEATRVKPTIKLPPDVYPSLAIVERHAADRMLICSKDPSSSNTPLPGVSIKLVYLQVTEDPVDWKTFDTDSPKKASASAFALARKTGRNGDFCFSDTELVRTDGLSLF